MIEQEESFYQNRRTSENLDFFLLVRTMLKWKYVLILVPLIAFFTSNLISRCMTKTYEAVGRIYPSEIAQPRFPAQLLTINPMFLGAQSQSNYLKAIMFSGSFAKRVIENLDLADNKDFGGAKLDKNDVFKDARLIMIFQKNFKLVEENEGAFRLHYKSANRQMATDIVNSAIETLTVVLKEQVESKVDFLKEQVEKEKEAIESAERELEEFRKKHGRFSYTSSADTTIGLYAEIEKAKIMDEIALMGTRTLVQNAPDLEAELGFKRERDALKSRIESSQELLNSIDEMIKDLPETEIEALRIDRQLSVHNTLYVELLKQYEIEKSDLFASRREARFTVLDWAAVSPKPVSPRILVNSAVAFAASFILCLAIILFYEFRQRLPDGTGDI